MEKQSLFREYFPGYMGHIPYKSEVIGMTVGATNNHIKSLLTKEPDYKAQLEPIPDEDYTYYNRRYFTKDISKAYPLEEDKIYSNLSKDARTWISGQKHVLYPEHIPGYTGHLSGLEINDRKGSEIFGSSYAKGSSIAVKGNFCNDADLPQNLRYISEMKDKFVKPKIRSVNEEKELEQFDNLVRPKWVKGECRKTKAMFEGLSDAFQRAVTMGKKEITEVPYVVGYGGFRRGVVSEGMYGKSFNAESLKSANLDSH